MAQPEIKNRFENSKVYKLECNVTGLIYIGSTTSELNVRLSKHKSSYKAYLDGKYHYVTSFKVLESNDYDIHLLRSYDFDNNIDLLAKEGYYKKKINCVNKNTPGRTDKEYYQDNKIDILEYQTEYRKQNKAIINEKIKIYHNKNKAKIALQQKAVLICDCGCSYTKVHKLRHMESKKHIKLMANIIVVQIV